MGAKKKQLSDAAVKKEAARVAAALAWAQMRLRTSYAIMLSQLDVHECNAGTYMTTSRSERGRADAERFCMQFNPEQTSVLSQADIRRIAGHEMLHAVLFSMDETSTLSEHEKESIVYRLQRAFFGEIGEGGTDSSEQATGCTELPARESA